ncbi:MAG: TRAP transporter small permease subunit [Sphingomonas sp.]
MSGTPNPGEGTNPPRESMAARKVLLALGSAGLLTAMAADGVAVLGRHVGFTLPGSIEVFQLSAVVALSVAILLASLHDRHAAVDLIVGRASPRVGHALFLTGRLTLALTFALLCMGSIWVSADLWATHEMTEVLAIPLRPFRLFWIVCSGAGAVHFAVQFARALRA